MNITLRGLIELRLIIIEVYLEFIQVLKFRKGQWKTNCWQLETEFELLEERRNIRNMLNNLELERIVG